MKTKLKTSIITVLLLLSVLTSFTLVSCGRGEDEDEYDEDSSWDDGEREDDENADDDSDEGEDEPQGDNEDSEDKDDKEDADDKDEDSVVNGENPDDENGTDDGIESDSSTENKNENLPAKPDGSHGDNISSDSNSENEIENENAITNPDVSAPSEGSSSDSGSSEGAPGVSGDSNEGSIDADDPTSGGSDTVINQTVINNNITISGADTSVAYAATKGLRSAVSIVCEFTVTKAGSYFNPTSTTETYRGGGAGVIYKLEDDGSAFIITNFHVVYQASCDTANHISDKINVYIYGMEADKYAIPATYVGGSANYDIAVLRVDASSVLKAAKESGSVAEVVVANSDSLAPGHTTIAIGFPSMGGISVTSGIVSVSSEYLTMTAVDNSGNVSFRVIRTDAAVNAGNSGGGLFNINGELVGIVNAKSNATNVESVGYALHANVVRGIADNIIYYCYNTTCECVYRIILGIVVETTALSTYYDEDEGVIKIVEEVKVTSVDDTMIAHNILFVDDTITRIKIGDKTTEISKRYQVIDAMLDVRAGDEIVFSIIRGGIEMDVTLTATDDCLVAY